MHLWLQGCQDIRRFGQIAAGFPGQKVLRVSGKRCRCIVARFGSARWVGLVWRTPLVRLLVIEAWYEVVGKATYDEGRLGLFEKPQLVLLEEDDAKVVEEDEDKGEDEEHAKEEEEDDEEVGEGCE